MELISYLPIAPYNTLSPSSRQSPCTVPLLASLPELRGAGLPMLALGVLGLPFVPSSRYPILRPQKQLSPVEGPEEAGH